MHKLEKLFVCIGAQKAGTTWLYTVLSKDKRFSICPFVKEIHYLTFLYRKSRHLNNWRSHYFLKLCQGRENDLRALLSAWLSGSRKNLAKQCPNVKRPAVFSRRFSLLMNEINDTWYYDLLSLKKGQLCAMDITPDYAVIGVDGFAHLANLANKVYVLYILRNPVHRAWSGLLQGKKKAPGGIDKFISTYGNDVDYLFKQCTQKLDIQLRNDYLTTLENINSAGIKDRVLVRFFDEISDNPTTLINDIYSFIEMEAPPISLFKDALQTKVYETKKIVMPSELELRLKDHYREMIHTIHTRHTPVPDSWLTYFEIQ